MKGAPSKCMWIKRCPYCTLHQILWQIPNGEAHHYFPPLTIPLLRITVWIFNSSSLTLSMNLLLFIWSLMRLNFITLLFNNVPSLHLIGIYKDFIHMIIWSLELKGIYLKPFNRCVEIIQHFTRSYISRESVLKNVSLLFRISSVSYSKIE